MVISGHGSFFQRLVTQGGGRGRERGYGDNDWEYMRHRTASMLTALSSVGQHPRFCLHHTFLFPQGNRKKERERGERERESEGLFLWWPCAARQLFGIVLAVSNVSVIPPAKEKKETTD